MPHQLYRGHEVHTLQEVASALRVVCAAVYIVLDASILHPVRTATSVCSAVCGVLGVSALHTMCSPVCRVPGFTVLHPCAMVRQ